MGNVITPTFRVSYPHVFKARKNDLSGKDEFSLVALFKKGENLKALEDAARDAIVSKWGPDKTKWPKAMKTPFRLQDERASEADDGSGKKVLPQGYELGAVFMNLKSSQRPGLVDGNNQDIITETDFYAGCYARASVRAFAYDQKGNRGVSFSLQNIQKVKEGDPIGSRTRAQDDFAPIAGAQAETPASSLFN